MIVEPGIKENLRWFYDAKFGMFVHFGIYALVGRGEWLQYDENIPRGEYEKLAAQFNPAKFDADDWVGVARDAGACYITVTSKHHDGFCMFGTEYTDYNITNTPFGRDLIGELIAACQRQGMRIILYYSQPDWHHPNYVHYKGAFKDLVDPPDTDEPDWPKYQEFLSGQVTELCTNYGKIDGIWFDGSHKTEEAWQGGRLYEIIKQHQPDAVVNDRSRCGDFFTPERALPDDLSDFMFEACDSISPTAWGYQADPPAHSLTYLVGSLVRMCSSGGNYLLNVGPAPDGTIPEQQARIMGRIGQWLKTHAESIYETEPLVLSSADGPVRATRKGTSIYLHWMTWPDADRIQLPGIDVVPQGAELLSTGEPIRVRPAEGSGIEIFGLVPLPPDPLPQVMALRYAETPRVAVPPSKPAPVQTIEVAEEAPTVLPAASAELLGRAVKGKPLQLQRDAKRGREEIGGWFVPEQQARWSLSCRRAGTYALSVSLWCGESMEGMIVRIQVRDEILLADLAEVAATEGGFTLAVGAVSLPAGELQITLSPEKLKWGYVFCSVEQLALTPVNLVFTPVLPPASRLRMLVLAVLRALHRSWLPVEGG